MKNSIAIIGGGPAGLSAAIRAAELGLKVILYEKGKIGTGIRCAEGFIDTLGCLGKPESGVLFKVDNGIFFAGKAHFVSFSQDHGIWMIDRSIWQISLAKKAQALGVSIKEKFPIGKNQLSKLSDEYSYVIDASGAPSVTSRMYGFVPDYLNNAMLLAQYVIEGDFRFLGKNTLKASFETQNFGYHYIFPKGNNIANVGVGQYHSSDKGTKTYLRKELDRILKKERLDGYRIQRKISGFTPSLSVNRLIWGNILLVGDAAALCSPLHGGGVDTACISGRIAAEIIASQKVNLYPISLWEVLGKKLVRENRIRRLWQFFGYPFIRFTFKFPSLIRSIFFSQQSIQAILGLGSKRLFY